MGFKANWSEAAQSNSLKPEGDYECLIAKAEERDYTNSKGEEKNLPEHFVHYPKRC